MVDKQELQVQEKREVEKGQEATTPTRAFMPNADVFETEDALVGAFGFLAALIRTRSAQRCATE